MKPVLFHKSRNGIKSKYWYVRFQCDGMPRKKEVNLKVKDKQLAQSKANKLILQKEKELLGESSQALKEAVKKPILEHLELFLDDCRAIGRGQRYTRNIKIYINIACRECGWKHLPDITASKFEQWRAKSTLAGKTLNEYLSGLNVFINWLYDRKMLSENPLKVVKRVDTRRDEKTERRALSFDELKRLVNVACPVNRASYLLAAYNGLRRGELLKLEWKDLSLDGENPVISLRVSTTKNAKSFVAPLRNEVVNALLAIRPETISGKVFPKLPRLHRMVAKDWKAANIEFIDKDGRRADFHSLRKTFCTMMQNAGVPQRIAQEAMRHSDPRLTTQVYTDTKQFNMRKALSSLPGIIDDKKCPPICPPNLVPKGQNLSFSVTLKNDFNGLKIGKFELESHALSVVDMEKENGRGSRIRTHRPF